MQPVRLTVRQWQLVDSVFDNEVHGRVHEYRSGDVAEARAIREAGWAQVAGRTDLRPGFGGWPAGDEVVIVSLSDEQWTLVQSVLRRAEDDAGDTDPEGAGRSAEVQRVLSSQLRT